MLQSDWFWEWTEFSNLDHSQGNPSMMSMLLSKYEKNKYIIYWPWSVCIQKNCVLGLEYRLRPQDPVHSLSVYMLASK